METKLILNDEVIEERLQEKGFEHPENMDDSQYRDAVLKYYEAEITDDWNGRCDAYIYSQSTADGYEVYIVTEGDLRNGVDIGSDVYYYKDDLGEQLKECILNSGVIRIDPGLADDIHYEDIITEMYYEHQEEFEELLEDLKDEADD